MHRYQKRITSLFSALFISAMAVAQTPPNMLGTNQDSTGLWFLLILVILPLLVLIGKLYFDFKKELDETRAIKKQATEEKFSGYVNTLNKSELQQLVGLKKKSCCGNCNDKGSCSKTKPAVILAILFFISGNVLAQDAGGKALTSQPGIIITIVLLMIPVLLGVAFAMVKSIRAVQSYSNSKKRKEATQFAAYLEQADVQQLENRLKEDGSHLDYALTNSELAGVENPADTKGIVSNVSDKHEVHFTALKKKAVKRPSLDANITQLILWYCGCSVFWLFLGTGIGEYLGIKFVAPDADHISWLSFGRLRPVHTNIVFWGWASLGMIGLGYYVVPTVSNTKIYSIRWGWIALVLTNLMIISGSLCLMGGINNGGGEFREYTWPVMALFAVALILTLANFILTVAKRTTKEIYISNWYIIGALIFTIIVALTAYLPFWQNGIGETIIQGYFMHSGVGMWFTLFTLGLLYYFIPQQMNKPIYAYSLGILAFWTQIIFYTVIGTHHFVFSAIPWWLQTVGIVGSAGMIIPVIAATTNYMMTFKGQWNKVSGSYTLPFFLVAVVYYFLVSMQGTVEAFRFTNLLWHFTDFTVAHAHAGFYGIITFALWGGMYAIVPRLTGKEPPQHMVGAHFWLAFIGLLFYVIPLSIGATFRGMMWMEQKPFIESVTVMFEFWLWRAIGGSLMFLSHLLFAYNFYKMAVKEPEEVDVKTTALAQLEKATA
jgi:cytochrome c oxidase cbb3-type subunit I